MSLVQVGHVPCPGWACPWPRLGMSLVQVGHVPGPGWAILRGPKIRKIAQGHNSTHMRAQNFSTTAPGRKSRDLQVSKIQKIQKLDLGTHTNQKNGGSVAWGASREICLGVFWDHLGWHVDPIGPTFEEAPVRRSCKFLSAKKRNRGRKNEGEGVSIHKE